MLWIFIKKLHFNHKETFFMQNLKTLKSPNCFHGHICQSEELDEMEVRITDPN